jgi:hypothetical protein
VIGKQDSMTSSIPTTFEMDSIFTEQDIRNKDTVMLQCRNCSKWTQQNMDDKELVNCEHCGVYDYDPTSAMSLRTWTPQLKRKVK